MIKYAKKYILMLVVGSALAACVPVSPTYEVVSPAAGDKYVGLSALVAGHPSLPDFEIIYPNTDTDGFDIFLNGHNIRKHTKFENGSGTSSVASIPSKDLDIYMLQGENELNINPTEEGPKVNFIFDSQGPKITMGRADISGANVTIQGTLQDSSGIQSLYLQNNQASINDKGQFTLTVPVQESYTLVAKDTLGLSSSSSYLSDGAPMPMFDLRIGQPILNAMIKEIEGNIGSIEQVLDVEPVIMTDLRGGFYSSGLGTCFLVIPCRARLAGDVWMIDVEKVEIDGITINELKIVDGGIYLNANLDNMIQRGQTHIRNCNDGGIAGGDRKNTGCWSYWSSHSYTPTDLGFKTAVISGNLNFSVDQGKVSVSLADDFKMELGGAYAASGTFSSGALSTLMNFANGVGLKGLVSSMIKGTMERLLEQQLGGLFVDLNIDIPTPTGATITVAALPKAITAKSDGIFVNFTGAVSSQLAQGVTPTLGSNYISNPLPELVDDANNQYDSLFMTVNTNLVNQILLGAYKSGMTHITVTGTQLDFGVSPDEVLDTQDAMRVKLTPAGPGGVIMAGNSETSQASVQFDNMTLSVQTKNLNGSWPTNNLFEVQTNVSFGVKMQVRDNALFLSLNGSPKLTFNKASIVSFLPIDPALLDQAANQLISSIVPAIANEEFEIELPSIGGIEIETYKVETKAGHLNFTQGYVN